MRPLLNTVVITLVALILFVAFTLATNDLWRAAVFEPGGFIEAGSKFGIEIGMPTGEAIDTLKTRGFEDMDIFGSRLSCDYKTPVTDQQIDSLINNGMDGVICLESKAQKITAIGWRFELFVI